MNQGDVLDKHLIEGSLGGGSYGKVYRVIHQDSGTAMALKVASSKDPMDALRFQGENEIMHKLKPHPKVVQPFSNVVQVPPDTFYYTMELVDTNLADYMSLQGYFSPSDSFKIFKDICEGLAHAHQASIAHRDLHYENVLLNIGSGVYVKLTDFGKAKDFDRTWGTNSLSPCWGWFVSPPEVFFKVWDSPSLPESIAGDMYALGILLFSLIQAKPLVELDTLRHQIKGFLGSHPSLDYLDIQEKNKLYRDWIHSRSFKSNTLNVRLSDTNENAKINSILDRLTHIDHSIRFKNIAELQEELILLGL
ncbi:protein kinase [Candidatus Parcubacteria bacterium]|nr:protein kinase [Candidatus Parcubacteria bacterium]